MISIGNVLFRYRNQIFPLIIIALFLSAPPSTTLFGSETMDRVRHIGAWLLAFLGLLLRATVIGYAYIQRGGRDKKVYAKDLVTEGMFSLCRNPLYVGNLLIYTAVFLMHGHPLVIVVGVGLFCFMYQCIVYAEEAFLAAKFGEGYVAYCAEVPRWIPLFWRFSEATEDMTFNVKRVIAKDYSTASATLITLLAAEFYGSLVRQGADKVYPTILGTLIVITALATLLISRMKKRGVFQEIKTV